MKFSPGQLPPDFCHPHSYPWIIPPWTTTSQKITPQWNPAKEKYFAIIIIIIIITTTIIIIIIIINLIYSRKEF